MEKQLICYWKIICSCSPRKSEKHPIKLIYHLGHNLPADDIALIVKPFFGLARVDADETHDVCQWKKSCLWIMKLREFSIFPLTASLGITVKGKDFWPRPVWIKRADKHINGTVRKWKWEWVQTTHGSQLRGKVEMACGGLSLTKLSDKSGFIPSLGDGAFQTFNVNLLFFSKWLCSSSALQECPSSS